MSTGVMAKRDRTRGIQVFMTGTDEARFSEALILAEPDIRLIDGQRWSTTSPPLIASIADATSRLVYLWSPRAVSALPTTRRPDGVTQGPISGVVIQIDRSRMVGNDLLSGSLSTGFAADDKEMDRFVTMVWRVLRQETSDRIETFTGDRRPYRIGRDAARWARESEQHRLRDRGVDLYFRLID